MNNLYTTIILSTLILSCSQELPQDRLSELKRDIEYLASDELEGRETGTKGEALAATYIADRYLDLGLVPYGQEGTYFQEFEFKDNAIVDNANLEIGGIELKLNTHFYPISYSGNGKFEGSIIDIGYGINSPENNYNDFEGKGELESHIVLMNISSPDGIHPHSAYIEHHDLGKRIEFLDKVGVSAVLLINTDENADEPSMKISRNIVPYTVPVLFLDSLPERSEVIGSVQITRPTKTGKNVVGFLNKNADNTVVIGAHYDHLGFGENGSLYRGEEKMIHNGADDNASGVACLFQLAEELAEDDSNNNFLFIAFSGEEKGLLGSNYFVKNPPLELSEVNYMLNMDMVGRLKDESAKISINGIGTSPSFAIIDSLVVENLGAVTTESGVGASDHTSFYLQDVPAIHFFSGSHEDYHKPSDDVEKINYDGMSDILDYMLELINQLNDDGKLEFTKTKDQDTENTPRFKVTLGVIPDYLFDGQGMRIDGISEERPAQKGGLMKGDIVIKMGDHEVRDMMGYMKALSKFEKGDTTTVIVQRGETSVSAMITFD